MLVAEQSPAPNSFLGVVPIAVNKTKDHEKWKSGSGSWEQPLEINSEILLTVPNMVWFDQNDTSTMSYYTF